MSAKTTAIFFDLEATLFCGQCFSWEQLPGGGVRRRFRGAGFISRNSSRDLAGALADPFWRGYFDWDFPYAQVRAQFSAMDPILKGRLPPLHRAFIF